MDVKDQQTCYAMSMIRERLRLRGVDVVVIIIVAMLAALAVFAAWWAIKKSATAGSSV